MTDLARSGLGLRGPRKRTRSLRHDRAAIGPDLFAIRAHNAILAVQQSGLRIAIAFVGLRIRHVYGRAISLLDNADYPGVGNRKVTTVVTMALANICALPTVDNPIRPGTPDPPQCRKSAPVMLVRT